MNLIVFLYIASFFSLVLGEFGQFPFGRVDFSISVVDVLLTLNLVALLIWNIAFKKDLEVPNNFIYLVIFWFVAILSLILSLDLSGWLYLLRFIIYSSTFYVTFHLAKSGILRLKGFLTLFKVTALVLAILGVGQIIAFPDLEVLSDLGYDPHKYRLFSTFLDPNLLGAFLNFSLALVVYELSNKRFENFKSFFSQNHFNIISAFLIGSAIILTFSRSAYLMLAVVLFLVLAVKNKRVLAGLVVLAVMLYFLFPAFNNRINGALSIDASASERFYSWDKGLIIFQSNPILGVGFNNIRNYSQKQDLVKLFSSDGGNSGSGVDASLIFVLATTGLIGFLSYVLFILRNLTYLISSLTYNSKYFYNIQLWPVILKSLKRAVDLPRLGIWQREQPLSIIKPNYLSLPLTAITFGLIVNSFFINSLFFPPIMFLWFSFLGAFYGLGEGEGEAS